tara:strand:+ start:2178 stop:2603 length:426 start_codon:yes stop_codon:yes gene_type:complete
MKITLWVTEETLKQINSGEPITGDIFMREPGEHVDVLQVQVSEDEYYEILDRQAIDSEPTMDNADLDGTGLKWECETTEHPKMVNWEGSLPEGAEWGVSYSFKDKTKGNPTFADVYDLTRATPNNFELGVLIRRMVNDSDE